MHSTLWKNDTESSSYQRRKKIATFGLIDHDSPELTVQFAAYCTKSISMLLRLRVNEMYETITIACTRRRIRGSCAGLCEQPVSS